MRDKLLGLESDDIDLALDTMMGEQFANTINSYLKSKGQVWLSVPIGYVLLSLVPSIHAHCNFGLLTILPLLRPVLHDGTFPSCAIGATPRCCHQKQPWYIQLPPLSRNISDLLPRSPEPARCLETHTYQQYQQSNPETPLTFLSQTKVSIWKRPPFGSMVFARHRHHCRHVRSCHSHHHHQEWMWM